MAKELKNTFPEIEEATRVYAFNAITKRGESEFNESIRAIDKSFFQVFDFNIVKGNKKNPFSHSNMIILSESSAKKYFGEENPIGKSLSLEFNDEVILYEVSAIVSDPPQESSIQFQILVSLENEARFFNERIRQSWFNVSVESYLLLQQDQSAEQLQDKFPTLVEQYLGDNYEKGTFFVNLQPLTEIHLDTSLPPGIESISDSKYSYIMATVGFLILLLACINFVTLAVGRSFSRATEVGVRKALGAYRKQIIHQFWGEALLVTVIAVVFGIVLVYLFQSTFNSLTGKPFSISFDMSFWLITLSLTIFVAILSGIYPSIVLSKFNPNEILRGKVRKGTSMGAFGKSLVVFQFVASIVMLIGTLAIGRQIDFIVNKDLGYQKETILVVPTHMYDEEAETFAKLYIDELKKETIVERASQSMFSFAENGWANVGFTDGKNKYREFSLNIVDEAFQKTHGIEIIEGRDFQLGNTSDTQNGVLVNEAFVKQFDLKNPVGKPYDKFDITIVGVMKNFNFESLNNTIKPLMLTMNPEPIFTNLENVEARNNTNTRVSVKLNTIDVSTGIALLKDIWTNINPSQEFEYTFLNDALSLQYESEKRSKNIVDAASIIAIFIACMGMFGLATLIVARRTAEIGVRKVMGASVTNILVMISKDFVKLILFAVLFAFPLAWWGLNEWIQDFAYKVEFSWWIYVLAGIIISAITMITVSLQSISAAKKNPVKSLRTE